MRLSFEELLWFVPAFVIAITVHEASHALAATLLGDATPRQQGRLTLNPLRHLDPLGTILLVMMGFGWGKPVLVNPHGFRLKPIVGMALVAAAGPASNLLMAALFALPLRLDLGSPDQVFPGGGIFLGAMIWINVILAVFNMIPLPPLDGFSVLMGVLPSPLARTLAPIAQYGPPLLLLLFFLPSVLHVDLVGPVITRPANMLFRFVLGA